MHTNGVLHVATVVLVGEAPAEDQGRPTDSAGELKQVGPEKTDFVGMSLDFRPQKVSELQGRGDCGGKNLQNR